MKKLFLLFSLFSSILAMDAPDADMCRAIEQSALEAAMKASQETVIQEQERRDAQLAQILQEQEKYGNNPIPVRQPKQNRQHSKIEEKFLAVFQQKGLMCGLRSLHNSSLIWEYIHNRISEQNMKERLLKETTEGLIPTQNEKHAIFSDVGTEDYDEQNIQELRHNHTNIPEDKFFVIAHADIFLENMNFYHRYKELSSALTNFKTNSSDALCFIVGNIPLNKYGTGGGYGHWIGVIAHKKNNQITLYIADSITSQDEYAQVARVKMMTLIHKLIK